MATDEPVAKKPKIEGTEEEAAEEDSKEIAVHKTKDGESFFELSTTRRVTVRAFKGRGLIDIREVSRCYSNFSLEGMAFYCSCACIRSCVLT